MIPRRVEDYRGCEEHLKAMGKLGLNECSSVLSGNMERHFTISTLSTTFLSPHKPIELVYMPLQLKRTFKLKTMACALYYNI